VKKKAVKKVVKKAAPKKAAPKKKVVAPKKKKAAAPKKKAVVQKAAPEKMEAPAIVVTETYIVEEMPSQTDAFEVPEVDTETTENDNRDEEKGEQYS
jgi:hypothetical protein